MKLSILPIFKYDIVTVPKFLILYIFGNMKLLFYRTALFYQSVRNKDLVRRRIVYGIYPNTYPQHKNNTALLNYHNFMFSKIWSVIFCLCSLGFSVLRGWVTLLNIHILISVPVYDWVNCFITVVQEYIYHGTSECIYEKAKILLGLNYTCFLVAFYRTGFWFRKTSQI